MNIKKIVKLEGRARCLPCGCIEHGEQGIKCAKHKEAEQ